jgi:monoamine oxidase
MRTLIPQRHPANRAIASAPVSLDVLVVGAGITGLRAAARLLAAGRSVAVLEARERVGGRLHSVSAAAGHVDLGATWFWPGERRVTELAAELGLRLHQQHLAGDAVYFDGVARSGARSTGGDPATVRLDGNPVDVPAYRFSDGAASLARAAHAALPADTVRCGEPVSAIRLSTEGVLAEHPGGPTRAGAVLLALPPALAVATIAVDPPLPPALARAAAGTPVWMGAITKVVAVYGRPFWREAGLSGSGVSRVGPIGELHDMCGPGGRPAALFGFAQPSGPPPTRAEVLDQLAALFGPAARDALDVHIQDWRRERWTSPPGVERLSGLPFGGPGPFRDAAHGRIRFASTETAAVSPGHIEGALAAADAAAEALLRSP